MKCLAVGRVISIVDDDESVRRSLTGLLRSVGYAVKTFASAEDFLDSAHLPGVACLLLDVRMPGMSGLALQARLAAGGFRIPIIFLTAHGDQAARARALSAGAVEFLLTPFDGHVLLDAVNVAVAG